MRSSRWGTLLPCVALALAAGCRDQSVVSPESSYRIRVASGDLQSAPAGARLADALTVVVEDPAGTPAKGVRVRFSVTRGGGGIAGSRLDDAIGVTGPNGTASSRLVLGATPDTTWVEATLAAVDGIATRFTEVAVAAPSVATVAPADFRAGDTLTLGGTGFVPGQTVVRIGATPVAPLAGGTATRVRAVVPPCLAPGPVTVAVAVGGAPSNGAGATYRASRAAVTLRPFESVTIPASQLADCIALAGDPGASFLLAAQFASSASEPSVMEWRLGADGAALPVSATARAPATDRTWTQRRMEAGLRELERRIAGTARAEYAARAAGGRALLRSAVPPEIGSTRTFTVVAAIDGSRFVPVTARLRYVGDHVLVYTDTSNAALPDSHLEALATLMDRDLYPATVNAFGSEPDVDGNGKVIMLLTPVVNAMSVASECVQRGYVTGFFYGLDVLERVGQSNRAEVFYGYVPDSVGRYSCAHTEAEVVRTLQGTFAHELQHLISFNQHVLARGGDAEETWLNEGLSHIAEELISKLFEARYPAPSGRSTKEQLFPDSAAPFIAPQLLNAYVYLNSTLQHSVTSYEGTGSIEERGATWLFLRWLGDQKGDAIFRRLVEAPVTGVTNVERVSGEAFGTLFGDFSLALIADSIPGVPRSLVPSRQRFHSRNLRQLMAREAVISGFPNPFPLPTYMLQPGGSLRSAMPPGTMMHAFVRNDGANGPLRLAFTTPGLAPLAASAAGQVGIMRLPP